ncbi:Glycosyltransferase involved in cell wall bisynthesis [Caloramator quimbayensis]|uniref:Glycosyltransferase involved in cell wall bisynthesis n=1 Tax=Caloramator quimbayensis TaxID=1147123 RepID=A0A1T4Y5A9_9CLOT|nr:glycosyltransferase family 4 protein [Caloramator quimbayensis]SKA96475.1 Glycosyltransferase involved in cell wall bisynthesis [Caloramator quimbayensis]
MNILFLTQYFPPEVGAPQNRIFEFAKRLKDNGHDITVLTAMPNYPKGEIYEGYKGKSFLVEDMDGIEVVRTSIYATKSKGFVKRLLNYFSFTFSSVFQGLKHIKKPIDVVITESPPLFLGWSGYVISKRLRAKYVFNISDLWPESAVKLGVLNNKLFIALSTYLEEFCYRKADIITGQTRGIVDNISGRGFKDKTYLVTNGVDTKLFGKDKANFEFIRENNLEGKFIAGYAGIHGIAQGLEVIIKAADILKDYKDIVFVFVGDGPEKQKLIEMKEDLNLKNVLFLPVQPKKNMPGIVACFDCAIVPLKKLDLFKGALPSKMFETLASKVPIVLSVEGEAKEFIENANGGICVEPENEKEIAQAVLKLYKEPELKKQLGEDGRKYIEENYDRDKITRRFEDILKRHGK